MGGDIWVPEALLPAAIPGGSERESGQRAFEQHHFLDPPRLCLSREICRKGQDEGRLLRSAKKVTCLLVCQIYRTKLVPSGA